MDFIGMLKGANAAEMERKALRTIVADLHDKNLHGMDRALDLSFFEDEKAFASYGAFVPGCVYIFDHRGDSLRLDGKDFHDTVPVMLALSNGESKGRRFVFGINLNILTRPVRAAVLQELCNMDPKFFDTLIAERVKGRHSFSERIVAALLPDSGTRFCEAVCRKYRIDKGSVAFRRYWLDNISNCRLVDYWQWRFLPFLEARGTVRGIEIEKLRTEAINRK